MVESFVLMPSEKCKLEALTYYIKENLQDEDNIDREAYPLTKLYRARK